jgi:hypothetical protein
MKRILLFILSLLLCATTHAQRLYATLNAGFAVYNGNSRSEALSRELTPAVSLDYKRLFVEASVDLASVNSGAARYYNPPGFWGKARIYKLCAAGKLKCGKESFFYLGPIIGLLHYKEDYKSGLHGTTRTAGVQAGLCFPLSNRILWNLGFSRQWCGGNSAPNYVFRNHTHLFIGARFRLS